MATSSHSLTQFQLQRRLAERVCPVCRDRDTGLFDLTKNILVDEDTRSFKGSYWVCSSNRDHNHYYLSEGGANQGPREKKGGSLPPAALAEYTGTKIIRRPSSKAFKPAPIDLDAAANWNMKHR